MATKYLPGTPLEKPEALAPDHRQSTPQDFSHRLLFLFEALRWLHHDSLLPIHLTKLSYIRIDCEVDGNAEPPPATPPRLDDAIRAFKVAQNLPNPLSCFDWEGHFELAARQFLRTEQLDFGLRGFTGDPKERVLHRGDVRKHKQHYNAFDLCWRGDAILEYAPDHWGCMLADRTSTLGREWNQQDADGFFLRSELLACVALLCRQMHKTLWEGQYCEKFAGWELDVNDGPIKATVVSFTPNQVRVIRASCEPTSPSASLKLSFLASYPVADGEAGYSDDQARKILRWVFDRQGAPLRSPSDARNVALKVLAHRSVRYDSGIGIGPPSSGCESPKPSALSSPTTDPSKDDSAEAEAGAGARAK